MSINRVLLSGNLTRDPELRATAGGTPVLSIGLAVNDRRRNAQTGEWEDYPNFVDCSMFGTRAETSRNQKAGGRKIARLLTYATGGTIAVPRFFAMELSSSL